MNEYLLESVSQWEQMTGKRSRRRASLPPDVPRVSFYCAAGHEILWLVASFVFVPPDPGLNMDAPPYWSEDGYYPTREGIGVWIGRRVFTPLVGDDVVRREDQRDRHQDPDFRLRGALRCEDCGLAVPRRWSALQDDLTKLWNVGVPEVPLSAYAAMVDPSRSRRVSPQGDNGH